MYDRTNDERLKILQERLAKLKQKDEVPATPRYQREVVTKVESPQEETPREEKKLKSFRWAAYVLIIGIIAFVTTQEVWKWDLSEILGGITSTDEIVEERSDFSLQYTFKMVGDNIAIAASFNDEGSAKSMVKDLKVKGFKCDYFFLPNQSNSTEAIYKVFLGPYESLEETNQWTKNVEGDIEVLNL